MPQASIFGDDSTGHHDFPPRGYTTHRRTITLERRAAEAVGDSFAIHPCACGRHAAHGGEVAEGAATVTFEGRPAARLDDKVSCGGTIQGPGAQTVIIHGPATESQPAEAARRSDDDHR